MSAEVENNKEEETKEQQNFKQKVQKHWQIGIKILELLICVVCLGFIFEPANEIHLGGNYMHHTGVMYTAYTGYILINVVLLAGRAIGDRIPYITIIIFDVIGAGLFLITGILLLVDRIRLAKDIFHPRHYLLTMMTVSVCFAFANCGIFLLEAFLTRKRRQDL
ncbi:uncharacterized protein LOC123004336 isoform X2 [Tribolium madens]|uniref:uncharacterized protein LOC123004336 isoform X2 n=1 Tax=Tribolium madens TaxID=41895 RepID=UPI001CF72060|nr:uncharacterized protein LOC123004336 isoform X2 [Tribolium madens]